MNILSFLLLAFCLAVAYVSAYRIGSSRPGLLKSVFLQLAELHVPAANTDVSMRDKLFADMKDAMKSKDKVKLSGVRAILTAIKQREVDERVEVT